MKKNNITHTLAALSAALLMAGTFSPASVRADNPCIWNYTTNCPQFLSLTAPAPLSNLVSGVSFSATLVSTNWAVTNGWIVGTNTCVGYTPTSNAITMSMSFTSQVSYSSSDGVCQTLPSQSGQTCQITNPAPGTYTVTFTVTATPTPATAGCSPQTQTCTVTENVVCGGGGCGGGCNASSSGLLPESLGRTSVGLGSERVVMSLGPGAMAGAAGARPGNASPSAGRGRLGTLSILDIPPSAQLATPAALDFSGVTAGVELLSTNGQLRQVNSANGLADIVTNNASQYQVRFYDPSHVGSKQSDGLYHPSGWAVVTNTFLNPATDGTFNRLWVYQADTNGPGLINKFIWHDAAGSTPAYWELVSGGDLSGDGGPRHETLQTIAPDGGGGYAKTEIRQVLDGDSNPLSKRVLHYQTFGGVDLVVSEIVDPDGPAPLTNTYDYDGSGRLVSQQGPDGAWSSSTLDALGRPTAQYSGFLNQTPTSDGSLCQVKTYYYDAVGYTKVSGSGDDGSVMPQSARAMVETLLGSEVSRQYTIYLPGERRDIQCQMPGALWDAADNLKTITKTYTNGPFSGEVSSVTFPDGTMAFYTYAISGDGAFRTNTVDQGQPNTDGPGIADGTRTVTVSGLWDETYSRTVTDILSGLAEDQVLYGDFDSERRPQQAAYLDGTSETWAYDCCGISSHTDRQGVQTSYVHDALKYPSLTLRDGITVITSYDVLGRLVSTIRQGTDATQMLLSTNGYDSAGRLNATYAPGTGLTIRLETMNHPGRTVTTTYTNGATAIETSAADGSLLSRTGTAVHSVRYAYGVEADDGGVQRAYTQEIKLDASGSDTTEWTKTYADMLGRQYRTLYAASGGSYPSNQSFYNNQGQLWKQVDPDGVAAFTVYNARGKPAYSIQAVSSSTAGLSDYGTLTGGLAGILAGIDRVTRATNYVTTGHGLTVRRTESYVWPDNNLNTPLLVASSETALDGLHSWQTSYGLTRETETAILAAGYVLTTNLAPDDSYSVSLSLNGRTLGMTNYDANGAPLGAVTNGYDAHQRRTTVADARNGTTTSSYNDADQITSVTTPSPDGVQSGLTTSTDYDLMGQAWRITQPDNTYVTNLFDLMGQTTNTSGSRTYPVGYAFDYAGRMETMTTWTNYASAQGAATTTWNYDAQRGWLSNKRYNDGTGPDYTYTAGGRLSTRKWARSGSGGRIQTTYGYGNGGDLVTVAYNDGATPGLTNVLDRLGRLLSVVCAGATNNLAYNDAGQQVSESWLGGPLSGLTVTNSYDSFLRRTNLALLNSGSVLASAAYGYDLASRLHSVASGDNSAAYSYLANSPLVDHILFTNNGVFRMVRTNTYDFLNRLLVVSNSPAGGTPMGYVYGYNAASQRTAMTNAAGERWDYGYDFLGQVTNGWKYDSGGGLAQSFDYLFDSIGNRDQSVSNGVNTGYVPNLINQYTAVGTASPTYDADGNLLSDGRLQYGWDAENRLVAVTNGSVTLSLVYDWRGRRIQKIAATSGVGTSTNNFVYDDWNLIAVLSPQYSVLQSFTWGLDLSGSLQGAGGVGGLLIEGGTGSTSFVAYDGNGNVMALADAPSGSTSAQYEYGPFGEVLRATGPMARANPFRFSTKYQDDETDLVYYGRRYLNTSTGRWVNRDPIAEQGGLNVYAFVGNNPTCRADSIGLEALKYSSEGRYYANGTWRTVFGIPYWPTYDSAGDESGKQDSPNAWFWQVATENLGDTGGLCNSTKYGDQNSSFVMAQVKNVSKCPLNVTCHCNVSFIVSNWSRTGGTGIIITGTLLGAPVYQDATMTPDSSGWHRGRAWLIADRSLTFRLAPGATHELYNVQDQVSVHGDEPGAGFQESGLGLCDCQAQ